MIPRWSDTAKSAVVSVRWEDSKGRGFILRTSDEPLIITAAHCLPELPPAHPGSYLHERTYRIVGLLGGEPSVFTECLFVDPIADVAILGWLDGADHDADLEWDSFREHTASLAVQVVEALHSPLVSGAAAEQTTALANQAWKDRMDRRRTPAWVLSLDGEWTPCVIEPSPNGAWFSYKELNTGIHGGMSGSPVLTDEGNVLGLVSLGENGSSPMLWQNLPNWLVQQLSGP